MPRRGAARPFRKEADQCNRKLVGCENKSWKLEKVGDYLDRLDITDNPKETLKKTRILATLMNSLLARPTLLVGFFL